jgi:branched-chain amino acid transport system substrate-binding protein
MALAVSVGAAAVARDKPPIVVGAAVALSGWMRHFDDSPYKGAQLAVEDINERGGVLGRKLRLVTADTRTDPAQSARAGLEVLKQGAKLVITSCDYDLGKPAAEAADKAGVVAFATCVADPRFGSPDLGRHVFSMATATPGHAAVAAEWAYERAGWRSVYMLTDTVVAETRAICGHFKTRWTELAGKAALLGEDAFRGTDGDFPAQVKSIRTLAVQPDFIFVCTGGPGADIVKQLRDAGIGTRIMATDSMDGDGWMGSVPNLSGFYFGAYGSLFGDDPNPLVRDFMRRFIRRFGDKPESSQALTGYSVVEAFARAVERAGTTDGKTVAAMLEKFKREPLLVGPTTFTADRHINMRRGQLIMEVRNGSHRAIEWYAPKRVPAPKP